MDNVVKVVTTADKRIITEAKAIPACPTTQESRKYSITPHMLRRHPKSTPFIQPNLGAFNSPLVVTFMSASPFSCLLSSRKGYEKIKKGKKSHTVTYVVLQ